MPIDLSLTRIISLLKHLGNPHITSFKSVHVAGTNGKGSTLAYLSSILTQAKIANGKFTSPHLITYNDCISINNQTYPFNKFQKVFEKVRTVDTNLKLGCTEFEILTATAFKIFEIEKVELALIEVGVGGRLDATNVIQPYRSSTEEKQGGLIVSGITKIAMDHEGLLGNSLRAIAEEKAGIIKEGIPVVIDGTQVTEVFEVLQHKAKLKGSHLQVSDLHAGRELLKYSPLLGSYQLQNLSVAIGILDVLKKRWGDAIITEEVIITGIKKTFWPGRLQKLTDNSTGIKFILDGAHNESAASELNSFLEIIRKNGIIFVVALTRGKSIENFFFRLFRKDSDTLLPFTFTQPENMPWIKSYEVEEIVQAARPFVGDIVEKKMNRPHQVFEKLLKMRRSGDLRPIVICGSLYLCSDILRHLSKQKECERVCEE